jgi:hypothetical protein
MAHMILCERHVLIGDVVDGRRCRRRSFFMCRCTLGQRKLVFAIKRDSHNFDVEITRIDLTMRRSILNAGGDVSTSTIPINGQMVGL